MNLGVFPDGSIANSLAMQSHHRVDLDRVYALGESQQLSNQFLPSYWLTRAG